MENRDESLARPGCNNIEAPVTTPTLFVVTGRTFSLNRCDALSSTLDYAVTWMVGCTGVLSVEPLSSPVRLSYILLASQGRSRSPAVNFVLIPLRCGVEAILV
ncbi:MAG: hypothetical protein QOJ99_4568 [Bryobacterales bacterium]|nr:hypothetical protein [Bryobacterales bacterium]